MGAKTGITWCEATWNPVIGCSHVSAGCNNCYAERVAARFCMEGLTGIPGYYHGVARMIDGKWTGKTVRKDPKFNPLTARYPRTIFVCSMGDLFHESVPERWIDEVMAIIALTPRHRYMILTKRPDRMLRYKTDPDAYDRVLEAAEIIRKDHSETNLIGIPDPVNGHFWRNLALGVSIENQATADERVAVLLKTPAAKRFVSFEPALGPVDLRFLQPKDLQTEIDALHGTHGVIRPHRGTCDRLDLVIMGGESGPKARPMHPDWARFM
ncbi:MAG: phage Gp37/Gp68 family protein, partial [Chlorobiales bacterium]|nr:phage Gp37/Gp68 family protein [Chlorobiales bacterium]